MKRIYLDRIAATPLHPEVLAAMLPFLRESYGNPQSLHRDGQAVLEATEDARERVARLIGALVDEIVFTASGSEANNLAVKGMALASRVKGTHLVVSAVEHPSVLNAAKALEKLGFTMTVVPVDGRGLVDPAAVEKALTPKTTLVSVMLANSEVGTIEPVAEIAALCKARNILVHTDAVAAVGSVPVDVAALGVDALSLAGAPFYGPKGAAALFLKKGTRLLPLVDGGIQEGGRRAGTENVPGIVGLGRAADIARERHAGRAAREAVLRDRLIDGVLGSFDRVILTGPRDRRLPYHASFCVEFVEGEALLLSLDMKGIAVSSGSACSSKSLKASHVLLAMGLDHALAQGSLVFSIPEDTSAEDIEGVIASFGPIIDRLRAMSPTYTRFLKEKRT
jgi:cysteine desulfurase